MMSSYVDSGARISACGKYRYLLWREWRGPDRPRDDMTVMPKHPPRVEELVDELFTAIEKSQGYAYMSDGETFPNEVEFFARIRGRLRWCEVSVKVMRDFLRKYDQLPKVGRRMSQSP